MLGKRVVKNVNNYHGNIRIPISLMVSMQIKHNNIIVGITENKYSNKRSDSSMWFLWVKKIIMSDQVSNSFLSAFNLLKKIWIIILLKWIRYNT